MFLNSWSLTLTFCSLIVVFLLVIAAGTAIRVIRFWDPSSDTNRQIRLESEIWLSSTLVAYALGFQIISLMLFVLAADHFCQVIVGAMCATGALLANPFGMPALLIKLAGVFLYGFWIVIHKLDITSEKYPLVKFKYVYLLLLVPFLFTDIIFQTLYIAGLKPDIITSCCAVVFSTAADAGPNLMESLPVGTMLAIFYGTAGVLLVTGVMLRRGWRLAAGIFYAAGWVWFFGFALVMIITVFSSYIYAMPFHNCPFCILKPEFHYIGFFIYASLMTATFFGIVPAIVQIFSGQQSLHDAISIFRKYSIAISLVFMAVFLVLSSYHSLMYMIVGGEF
ncbi:MAG: hypothetical protein KKE17_05900 [Proteobacteria bacterium]|nr:hypothetical protein [Pseudomonadota bacterium]